MRRLAAPLVLAALTACAGAPATGPNSTGAGTVQAAPRAQPPAPRNEMVDDYFGTKIADPYRWLEELDSPRTRAWVEAQNAKSRPLLAALPARAAIHRRLSELWSYERLAPPRITAQGGRVYTRHDALKNQPVLYVEGEAGEPRVLLDPNTWSADGADAMADWKLSPDGKHLAYAVQTGGSDWVEYRVLELATGKTLPDRIRGVNFNFDQARLSWRGGSGGFFYSRFPDPPAPAAGAPPEITGQKVYYHRLGTAQSADVVVYEQPDQPKWFVWGEATDDGRYLVVYVERSEDTEKQVYVRDLRDAARPKLDAPLRRIVGDFAGKYALVGNRGPVLYFRTSAGASRYKIVACDLRGTPEPAWRDVVPETADVLLDAQLFGKQIVASTLRDAAARLQRYGLDGTPLGEIRLPGLGTVKDLRGAPDRAGVYFSFESVNRPGTVYRHDLVSGLTETFHPPKVGFDPAAFVTEQVFFRSKDGTRVPMFVSRRRDLPKGTRPTILYGYGGFANPLTPTFSVPNLVWMERGGVYAQVSLRGGSEYGEAWHEAGMLAKKQNVFDDFIAAAEHLVRTGVTTPGQLAAKGRSNGGLLVGAVVNQRPELFGAATTAVGVLDMLRYHRFGIAYAWAGDYGTSETPEGFATLRAYSPLHNIGRKRYPAMLVTTAERDDRVHPLHSFKYTAALQAAQAGELPVVIRVETRAGHGSGGAGTPLTKLIDENADVYAFLERYTTLKQ